jgi:hypothetical protein
MFNENVESEKFSQSISRARSLTYEARKDFYAMNNFAKSEIDEVLKNSNSNLEQARQAIVEAKGSLDRIVVLLLR